MINLMKYKVIYLLVSLFILIPGIIALFVNGLNLSVDFIGGSVITYEAKSNELPLKGEIEKLLTEEKIEVTSITAATDNSQITVKAKSISVQKNEEVKQKLIEKYKDIELKQVSFETVGPTIGQETTQKAFVALFWSSLGILIYIAYAFRNVPKPYSSVRFGMSAIIAMLHDALMVVGIFSLLKLEVDTLFITALLTVIGFSVHDSIVVFDRIRENLNKLPKNWSFESTVNYSLVETLNRSLATSLTVILTLLSLYVLGGESIKVFVFALLVGITSGTYSSIFTASPLLVLWESRKLK